MEGRFCDPASLPEPHRKLLAAVADEDPPPVLILAVWPEGDPGTFIQSAAEPEVVVALLRALATHLEADTQHARSKLN